jgi:DNA-binding MarR family transcriptional regulator
LRTVASFQSAGYLMVESDTTDKRKKLVKLTTQGTQLAEKIASEIGSVDNSMFANLSIAEKLIMTELLTKCLSHIDTL